MLDKDSLPDGKPVEHSLYLVLSNSHAASQLIQLFRRWEADPSASFEWGLGKFKKAFEQLRDIRRWDVSDRIRDTGLIDDWAQRLELVGNSLSYVPAEIELWYRKTPDERSRAQSHVERMISSMGGQVKDHSEIAQIAYHGLLVELPVQQVQSVVRDGAESIQLLTAEEIMFVSPYTPMSIETPISESVASGGLPTPGRVEGKPRIALLDGLPVVNHDVLAGRLEVDDPDGLGGDYALRSRRHGTAMASLIIHGDLSVPGPALARPLYVRPIMHPDEFRPECERVVENKLMIDLLHRAVRRIFDGEGRHEGVARSVRIINLSIGVESRAFVRRISPLGRLLDWLAVEYNLLFVVSAGNHLKRPLVIPADSIADLPSASVEALKAARGNARYRGILPPGDSMNALTVGATHADAFGDLTPSDTVWDLVEFGMPALYSAVGPGVGRSIKPDLHHTGGRALYIRPVPDPGRDDVEIELAVTSASGPGNRVAAPGRLGATNTTSFTHGTSNATALVTREADRIFDILESGQEDTADLPFPDPQFHPVLAKALLVHSCDWGQLEAKLQQVLGVDNRITRKDLTALLGYGALSAERVASAATNRAVLVASGLIKRDERHTHWVPLPVSLRAKAEWRRFTVTLAYMAPTTSQLTKYRGAKVYFQKLSDTETGGSRVQADPNAVRRGTCQHEIIDGKKSMVFANDGRLPIHVECMDDAQKLGKDEKIRYGLVVSVETAIDTSTTIHQEIRSRLQAQVRVAARPRSR